MEINKQVCSRSFSESLARFGIIQESLYYHSYGVIPKELADTGDDYLSAFTCAELVQMNEDIKGIEFSDTKKKFFAINPIDNDVVYYHTFADALAYKLVESLEDGILTAEIVNKRLLGDFYELWK